ncbi:MAG: argininosuccinate lyase, partial [Spirochaetaceae bacterium]|nr:argininosuccinate lyase [Spirochaetaceae bacterium]
MPSKPGTAGTAVLWAGRLAERPEAEAFAFQSSITVDRRLAQEDIQGSRAHVAMLAERGMIPPDTASALDAELERLSAELAAGTLAVAPGAEDIHSFIEGVLTERLGAAGKMIHAGRSRNDQVAVDLRLYLKKAGAELRGELA